jgi:acetyl-CoA carboxylase biotin carboxyl carrier protein
VRIGGRRPPPAPDADLIRRLAELLAETGLSELEYESDGYRIRVARETAPAPPPSVPPAPQSPSSESTPHRSEMPSGANGADHPGAVTAPMVGVAYLAPQPGTAPFVQVGETVSEGQTLLVIEAMKVMNQIRSPRGGRIARILIADAEPVEYGAALMLIE